MPLIVVEGPEGAGKTTFAQALAWLGNHILEDGRQARYIHHGNGDSVIPKLEAELQAAYYHPSILYVFDRWWPSEYVYATLMNRPNTVGIPLHEAEKRYGAPIDRIGVRVLVEQPQEVLERRRAEERDRTEPDAPVRVWAEVEMYESIRLLAPDSWVKWVAPTDEPGPLEDLSQEAKDALTENGKWLIEEAFRRQREFRGNKENDW